MSDPQLAMRGPPGPAGMTGRSGPVVSSFLHKHTPLICIPSIHFTLDEKHIRLLELPHVKGSAVFKYLSLPNTYTCITHTLSAVIYVLFMISKI